MPTRPHPAGGFPADFVADRLDEALGVRARGVPVVGITGLQGSGKSTLVAQMAALARTRGLAVATLSIDDVYLGRRARQALGRTVHPLLATRGPPGTHDPSLAIATLDRLRAGEPTALPRFDKWRDTRRPPSRWPRAAGELRLVLFEGWFLKVPPEPAAALATPLNALEREEDADGRWRAHVNAASAAYAPLWRRIDWLAWLQGPGFECVPDWRWQQERRARAARGERGGLDRRAIERFVQFFERTSRQAQRTLPAIADRTCPIDADRRPLSRQERRKPRSPG